MLLGRRLPDPTRWQSLLSVMGRDTMNWWRDHGTKILGGVVIFVGAAGDSLSLITAVDPKHAALWTLIIGLGGAIIRRGFTNTASTP
jgi:hypothetical protein